MGFCLKKSLMDGCMYMEIYILIIIELTYVELHIMSMLCSSEESNMFIIQSQVLLPRLDRVYEERENMYDERQICIISLPFL